MIKQMGIDETEFRVKLRSQTEFGNEYSEVQHDRINKLTI